MDYTRDTDPVETQNGSTRSTACSRSKVRNGRISAETRQGRSPPKGAPVPYSANTPYLNTIPPEQQPPHPGRPRDRAPHPLAHPLERARDGVRANKESSELGGHIASFQSAATLYDTGFKHFWHAPSEDHGGDLDLYPGPLLARHLRPRLPRRAA